MYNVKDFEQVKKNCRSFWNKEFIGRPYITLSAPKKGVERPQKDLSYVRRVKCANRGDFESAPRDFAEVAQATVYYGEALPFYCADLCPDQYATFYGAEIVARDGEYTTWIKNNVADTLDELDVTFHRDNKTLCLLEKSIEAATRIADGNFLVSLPDFHSNLDALSALLTPTNLCYETIDNPELLDEKLAILNNDFSKIYDIFYKAGNMEQLGALSWIPLYTEGRYTIIQCDFSCMIGPEMARRFVIPSIEKEAYSVDHCVYHYDGKQALGHLDDVLAIDKLDCIQWVPGAGEKRSVYWMDLLKKIQSKGKSIWVYDWTKEEILADTELDPRLTVFGLELDSQDEAEDFMEKLEKKYN